MVSLSALAGDLLPLQGNVDLSGTPVSSGGLVVEIWDGPDVAGSNLIYNSTDNFTGSGNISSGKFDIVLGDALDKDQLNLEYGKIYYMDLYIAGNDMNFSGQERQVFMSSVGKINSSFLNTSNDYELNSLLIENKTIAVDDAYLNISDGTTPKLIVQPDGKVGIGTTAPTSALHLPLEDDAITPTLSFGDGDSGFYEETDDELRIAILGTERWRIASVVMEGVASNSASIRNEAASATSPTLTPSRGDPDTGIGWAHAGTISLIADGVNIMNLNASGNVGIGTTTPASLLEVNGTGSTLLNVTNESADLFMVNETTVAFGDGIKVGIGTTSPTKALEVGGDILANGGKVYAGGTTYYLSSGTSHLNVLYMHNKIEAWSGTLTGVAYGFVDDVDTGMYKPTEDEIGLVTGGTERIRIDSSGNVGIGTTSPSALLHIENSSAVSAAYLNISDGPTPKMVVMPDGKVGIGTTVPGNLLHVYEGNIEVESDTTNSGVTINADTNFNAELHLQEADATMWRLWNDANGNVDGTPADSFQIITGSGTATASKLFTLTPAGNVGISTTAPSALLHIENSSAVSAAYLNISDKTDAKLIVYPDGNVVIGGAEQPANDTMFLTIAGGGDLNVSGSIYYGGSQLTGSPFVVESVDGEPIPVCMKNSEGKWVGCMPDANNNWRCAPNSECDEKVLRIKTTNKLRSEGADDAEIGHKLESLRQKFNQGKSLQAIKDEIRAEVGDMSVLNELDDSTPTSFGIQTQSVSTVLSEDVVALKTENNAMRDEIEVLKQEVAELKVAMNNQQQPETTEQPTVINQPVEEQAAEQPSEEPGFSISETKSPKPENSAFDVTGAFIWNFFSKLF